ncbi:MAG TPA: hypothetical protein VEJ18_03565, partial [Planctomycetota bacterium]|nr:hypothetical protein [Planctomycetota bacterium]
WKSRGHVLETRTSSGVRLELVMETSNYRQACRLIEDCARSMVYGHQAVKLEAGHVSGSTVGIRLYLDAPVECAPHVMPDEDDQPGGRW